MRIYHNMFQDQSGQWCVDYTENKKRKRAFFTNNEDAVKFYMS